MATGTVKWFDVGKGYGFIKPDAAGPDIFVHITEVKKSGLESLSIDEKVCFDLEDSKRTNRPGAVRIGIKG